MNRTCANCYWWSALDIKGRKFIGVCGHREHAGGTTDRTETCDDHEPLLVDEEPVPEYLE